MTVIDLPADIVWLDDGKLGVAIVQGESHDEWMDGRWDWATVVAPRQWAQYDKPCWCPCHRLEPPTDRLGPCDVGCEDGRQVWTVRWPCRACNGDGIDGSHEAALYYAYSGQISSCETCLETPTWESARATIQVVPVVATYLQPDVKPPYVAVAESTGPWLIGEHAPIRLPLDPLPTPGRDYAVIVKVA